MKAEAVQIESTERRAGVAREFYLRIAGITTAILCDEPEMTIRIDAATQKFLVGEREPDTSVRVAWSDLREEGIGGEKIFDSGALWKLYEDDGHYLFRFATPHFGSCPYKLARFNRDFTRGNLYLHRPYFTDRPVYPLEYPLDELLMLNLLAAGRGAELHSCGVRDASGRGYLFIGQSGAGKTTMARLWGTVPGASILSDDRIILRQHNGERFWMYGTPWHGEAQLASTERAPLAAIFFLRHGLRNELLSLGRAESAARLFSCSFPTFYHADGLAFTLAFYEKVASAVPCYELSFTPDEGAVAFVRQHVA
jgi:hypothetical protein